MKVIWTPGLNLVSPDLLSRIIAIEEYQKHQLQHKRIPRDIEVFDENSIPVSYQIQHDDKPNATRNGFYPIKYKRGNEEKILTLQNNGEDITDNSVLIEFPITSVQQASDCFRLRRPINQFRGRCRLETHSNLSINSSNTDYNSIDSLSSAKYDTADLTSYYENSHHINTDSEDDNIVCDVGIQSDKPRLCQAKQAHELLLGKTFVLLVKNFLETSDTPHLGTKASIQKLDETKDLDVSTTLTEHFKTLYLVLYAPGCVKTLPTILGHQRLNSLKVSCDIVKNSTDFFLKKKDSFFATMNQRTN